MQAENTSHGEPEQVHAGARRLEMAVCDRKNRAVARGNRCAFGFSQKHTLHYRRFGWRC